MTVVRFVLGRSGQPSAYWCKVKTFPLCLHNTVLKVVVTMASHSSDTVPPAPRRSIRGQNKNTVSVALELYEPYERRKGGGNESTVLSRPRPANVYTCYEAQRNHLGVNLNIVACCKCKRYGEVYCHQAHEAYDSGCCRIRLLL